MLGPMNQRWEKTLITTCGDDHVRIDPVQYRLDCFEKGFQGHVIVALQLFGLGVVEWAKSGGLDGREVNRC